MINNLTVFNICAFLGVVLHLVSAITIWFNFKSPLKQLHASSLGETTATTIMFIAAGSYMWPDFMVIGKLLLLWLLMLCTGPLSSSNLATRLMK
ncbi:MAG: monovalent cation/H(+) antiporter subunit G [Pseudomonadota bacterium]